MSPEAKPAIMSGKTQVLGSITVIDTPLVTRAMDLARTHSEPFLFNHPGSSQSGWDSCTA